MTARFSLAMVVVLIGVTHLSCSDAPLVVQGSVIEYNATNKTLLLRDEQSPNQELTILLESADMGTEPKPGEIVRISYRQSPQGMSGIRVMNLSHQIK